MTSPEPNGGAPDLVDRGPGPGEAHFHGIAAAVTRLSTGIAHDFNNLLQVISGRARLIIESDESSAEVRGHAREIDLACERCNTLIRQLRAFGLRRGGSVAALDVDGTIRGLERALGHVAGEAFRVALRLDARRSEVMAEAADIEQLVLSLVLATRDAASRGGTTTILTRVCTPSAAFLARFPFVESGSYVEIAVTDQGSGLGDSAKWFLSGPAAATGSGAGAGLGLAMAYDTAKRLHGYIVEDEIPGYGVAICVLLPRIASSQPLAAQPIESNPEAGSLPPRVVLLVDDDDAVRRILALALTRSGFTVLEARNAPEAIGAGAAAERIDLLVTDMSMPVVGGLELARRMRRADPALPVVFLSGMPHESLESESASAPTTFVEKPFTSAEFIERVRAVLER